MILNNNNQGIFLELLVDAKNKHHCGIFKGALLHLMLINVCKMKLLDAKIKPTRCRPSKGRRCNPDVDI